MRASATTTMTDSDNGDKGRRIRTTGHDVDDIPSEHPGTENVAHNGFNKSP